MCASHLFYDCGMCLINSLFLQRALTNLVLDPAMVDCESWNLTLAAIESMLAGRPICPEKERLAPQVLIASSRDQRPESLVKKSPSSETNGAQQLQKRTESVSVAHGVAAASAAVCKQGKCTCPSQ